MLRSAVDILLTFESHETKHKLESHENLLKSNLAQT